jgi:hypothetical protein
MWRIPVKYMSPARKPAGLKTRHETAAEKQVSAQAEESMRPRRELPMDAPARLKDHKIAAATWREIMRNYAELEAVVVTRMDMDHLLDYCIMTEQVSELDTMRGVAYHIWLELNKKHEELNAENRFDDAVLMAISVVGAFDAIVKLDARSERKRALLKQYRESLYITPRARAGAAPAKKEKEIPPDEMEQLLDDVTDYVNGDQGHG